MPLWSAVKSAIQSRVNELRDSQGSEVAIISNNELFAIAVGTADHRRAISATFDEATNTLSWSCGGENQSGLQRWQLTVDADEGNARFHAASGGINTFDEIARKLLEALLEVE